MTLETVEMQTAPSDSPKFNFELILAQPDETPRLKFTQPQEDGERGIIEENWWRRHKLVALLFMLLSASVVVAYFAGFLSSALEDDFRDFTYPLDIPDFRKLIQELESKNQAGADLTHDSVERSLREIRPTHRAGGHLAPLKQFANLTYLIDVRTSCASQWRASRPPGDTSVSVVIVVKSAANNYARRRAIRHTWAENGARGVFQFKTVFMVGACDAKNPVPSSLQKSVNASWTAANCRHAIENESREYGDLVQSSGIDSYYNNTIKAVSTLRWVSARCASHFFLSLDDDFVFEVDNFEGFLADIARELSPAEAISWTAAGGRAEDRSVVALQELARRDLYAGYVRDFVHPHRHLTSKWYISRREYPYNKYPRFVTGGAILMSHRTVRLFALASFFTKSFKFDDVYLGIMAQKLEVESLHEENFMCDVNEYLEEAKARSRNVTACVGVHDISADGLLKLWSERPVLETPRVN